MARPVLIDCDPGTDDALALLLALGSPALKVVAVTVAGGNAGLERTLANACAVVGLSGRAVPVHAGAARPLRGHFTGEAQVHGADGLAGVVLPPGPAPAPGLAVDAIRAALRATDRPLTLIGLAPPTNLALALAAEPALCTRVAEIVLMGGAWGEGNATPAAEFNAYADPEALAILLGLGVPLTMAVLEVTSQVLATPDRLAALGSGDGRALAAVRAIQGGVSPSRRLGGAGAPLHDPCAVAYAIAPDLFHGRAAYASVDCGDGPGRGRTHIDRWGRTGRAANMQVLERVDADGVFALLGTALARLP